MKLRGNSDGKPAPLRPITGITPGNSTARNQANAHFGLPTGFNSRGRWKGRGSHRGSGSHRETWGESSELELSLVGSRPKTSQPVTVGSGHEKVVISAPLIVRKGGGFSHLESKTEKILNAKVFCGKSNADLRAENWGQWRLSYRMCSMWTSSA